MDSFGKGFRVFVFRIFFAVFKDGIFAEYLSAPVKHAQKYAAENTAGDDFPDSDGEKQKPIGILNAVYALKNKRDDDRVGQNGGDRCKILPFFSEKPGADSADQRGERSENDIPGQTSREHVRKDTSYEEARYRRRSEIGKDSQHFGQAHLNDAARKSEERTEIGEDHIECGNHCALRNDADAEAFGWFFHEIAPVVLFNARKVSNSRRKKTRIGLYHAGDEKGSTAEKKTCYSKRKEWFQTLCAGRRVMMQKVGQPKLLLVIPCYNEEQVLPLTAPLFLEEIRVLTEKGKISGESGILFVDDGSRDGTWDVISSLARENAQISGIRLSRNRGHQNALLAGLMEARDICDISVSMDCDGQDDIGAAEAMVDAYLDGCDVVYGVRSARKKDSFFKRSTARGFYRLMNALGAETVYDHADYRLLSNRVLKELGGYREVNLFLRGMIPLIGFRSTCVPYERHERAAGKSKYPLRKMLSFAVEGITSLSTKPIRIVSVLGFVTVLLSIAAAVWAFVCHVTGKAVAGWSSVMIVMLLLGGVQLLSLGVIGEYVGKIYMESKGRPRFIVSERTREEKE